MQESFPKVFPHPAALLRRFDPAGEIIGEAAQEG